MKHGLVKQVSDWQYSSFHRDMKLGLFPKDWGNCVDDACVRLYDDESVAVYPTKFLIIILHRPYRGVWWVGNPPYNRFEYFFQAA